MLQDFKVLMANKWYLTSYEAFNEPSGSQLVENLRVTLTKNILVIEGLAGETTMTEAVIQGRRSLDLGPQPSELAAFVIVEENLTSTSKPFPAQGTAIVYREGDKWRLRAAGFDRNGQPKGWIFDATETGPG
ncbi:hypothetical protein NKI54_23240 [Mesorhizobium sp. M0663]|uniref:hypothetical protein n=1 Tax=unclassified Mesorhizobium TaxID=325217 RepID=UPI003334A814